MPSPTNPCDYQTICLQFHISQFIQTPCASSPLWACLHSNFGPGSRSGVALGILTGATDYRIKGLGSFGGSRKALTPRQESTSTGQALALKVWDSTGSVTGPGLSSRENKQHHIFAALCSGVFPVLNCCILQQMGHSGFFSLQFSNCKHQGELATVQGCSTAKPRALLKLPARELVTDSVPTVIRKTMVTSGIFHSQGCQALSAAPHQWGRNDSTTSGLFEGCRARWVCSCSG